LKEKYELKDATTTLQEVFARSVLSREYGNAKIATHELQAVMRRGTPTKIKIKIYQTQQYVKRNKSPPLLVSKHNFVVIWQDKNMQEKYCLVLHLP
jgi:hypothetical protein